MTTSTHHIESAQGTAEHILELYTAWTTLSDGDTESVTVDGDTYEAPDEVIDAARELPLEVAVRSDWFAPGSRSSIEVAEYLILLSTGGPAVQITGRLGDHCQPSTVDLQAQDWGTPWVGVPTTSEQDEALEWFAQLFYYGEG